MGYTPNDVLQYVQEEDVKFIRLAFCDVFGKQKNISIMPGELPRAFADGIAIDSSAVAGFGGEVLSDLLLFPDPATISLLPWRPEHGRVVRMFCALRCPDGSPFRMDCRALLRDAVADASERGISFSFGSETEFYLFKRDLEGNPTKEPQDHASYMDIAPEDRGENIRREICLTLEQMGIQPERSHHEQGPGQNEVDFHYADPLTAADNAVTFRAVVNTIAARNGLYADFSPKPLPGAPGNGMHISLSAKAKTGDPMPEILAGILKYVPEMTLFLNPVESSYHRLGSDKAPRHICWSECNRTALIRIPAAKGEYVRSEVRSPDPACNPYLSFALLIKAGLAGIREQLPLPEPARSNLFRDPGSHALLPGTLAEAARLAKSSTFLKTCLPEELLKAYCREI